MNLDLNLVPRPGWAESSKEIPLQNKRVLRGSPLCFSNKEIEALGSRIQQAKQASDWQKPELFPAPFPLVGAGQVSFRKLGVTDGQFSCIELEDILQLVAGNVWRDFGESQRGERVPLASSR